MAVIDIEFRADASNDLGTGHVMRCLVLADALRARGHGVHFIQREQPGHLGAELQRRGFACTLLPPAPLRGDDDAQALDARQTLAAMRAGAQWLVVDHYFLGAAWERAVRGGVPQLMAIDDLADRAHACDVLLDQNFSSSASRYDGLLPEGCRRLLGPRFALLSADYRSRRVLRTSQRPIARVVVFFGGSDPLNLTGLALQALCDPALSHLEAVVVVGVNNPHRAALQAAAAQRPRTRIVGPQPSLAGLMSESDLAIGAGGVTTWERMCIGLPSIVVSIAENQRPGSEALGKAGLIVYAGHHDQVDAARLAAVIGERLRRPETLADSVERGQVMVDGWGAERVAETLAPTARGELTLRPARAEDVLLYFSWASDPRVRANSLQGGVIELIPHRAWFAAHLASENSRLFVLLAGVLPVGQIRFDRVGERQRIDYSIDAAFRGRGWGSRLVELGLAAFPGASSARFLAEVKTANRPSAAVFEKLGFEEISTGPDLRVFEQVGAPAARGRIE